MTDTIVEIPCMVRAEVDNAYLIDDGDLKVWVPKSEVEIDFENKRAVAVMPEWLALKKGLI